MNCARCNDTGSLSKEVGGHLDCTSCDASLDRMALESWIEEEGINIAAPEAWLIYQKGRVTGRRETLDVLRSAK